MMDPDLISQADHIPVLLEPILENISPVGGVWIDATFGAGGYTRALLDAGAEFVFAIDRDPNVFSLAENWVDQYSGRIELINDVFSNLEKYADSVDGVVLTLASLQCSLIRQIEVFHFRKRARLTCECHKRAPWPLI